MRHLFSALCTLSVSVGHKGTHLKNGKCNCIHVIKAQQAATGRPRHCFAHYDPIANNTLSLLLLGAVEGLANLVGSATELDTDDTLELGQEGLVGDSAARLEVTNLGESVSQCHSDNGRLSTYPFRLDCHTTRPSLVGLQRLHTHILGLGVDGGGELLLGHRLAVGVLLSHTGGGERLADPIMSAHGPLSAKMARIAVVAQRGQEAGAAPRSHNLVPWCRPVLQLAPHCLLFLAFLLHSRDVDLLWGTGSVVSIELAEALVVGGWIMSVVSLLLLANVHDSRPLAWVRSLAVVD